MAGEYNLTDITLSIPDFGATFGDLLIGSYVAKGILTSEDEDEEFGCIDFTFDFVLV